ncbi:hypothetical protein [Macrococcoides bohemicum]|uniref:hypothetical protein n=1 Tax=Macrococcoides bohemicum TaxID=1903056 RepID=UPI00193FA109|nr:hypothetical protein [Macrococcus bohemicus]QRN48700.1 hypothetical protein HT586_00640 [Macrococcus bohemicus]QYA44849.1 hypothetical protein KYI13_00460 [Macrococcus bohemicus]
MKKTLVVTLTGAILLSTPLSLEKAEAATTKKLDEKSKIALAYFTKDIGTYSFTRKEVVTGKFVTYGPTGISKHYSKNFDVFNSGKIEGAPKNMRFYSTKISKGNFATIIGVSDSTIVIGGTQSLIDYKTLVKGGKKYSMKNYLKYQSSKDFKTIVSKTRIVKKPY